MEKLHTDTLPGTVLGRKYVVDRAIGKGGMGAVYVGQQLELDRKVAIKVLRQEYVASARESERFRREALAMAKLRHPNIVTVYDFGLTEDGQAYLVLEYLSGPTLEQWIAEHGASTPIEALDIIKPVCLAIDASHRAGIVHRDLKPSNIMLPDPVDPDDTVRVVDFGIARLREMSGGVDLTGAVALGTPAYMAPEQMEASRADHRSDIYSLGIVAYEILTGRKPFQASSNRAMMMQHILEVPKPPTEINPKLPQSVDAVLLKAVEKKPDDRFQTAREFADALADALGIVSYDDQLQQLRAIAERDELTGLFNRRTFSARLARAKAKADAESVPFGLAIMDVDNFKFVNDTYGHLAGDEVLREVAAAMRESARDEDAACRYAGDEFAIIVQSDRREALERVIRSVRKLIRSNPVLNDRFKISLSIGATLYQGTGEPVEVIVGTADRALYAVKQQGKDGYRFFNIDPELALTPSGQSFSSVVTSGVGERTPSENQPTIRMGAHRRDPTAPDFSAFVGRERELAALDSMFETAVDGLVSSALVVGDTGLGKTALIQRFVGRLADAVVIETRFLEGAVAPPYRAFIDPLGAHLATKDSLGTDTSATPAEARAFSAIARGDTSEFSEALGLGASETDRFRAFEILRRSFRRIGRERPVVLVAENLQWADSLSLEFLSYLISSAGESKLLVAGTARTEGLTEGSPLRTWARSLSRVETFNRIELAPLRSNEVRSLLDAVYGKIDRRFDSSRSLIERLMRETDGNPLLITEILRLWTADGTLRYDADTESWHVAQLTDITLPPSVLELFEARFARVDPAINDILRTAAVIGLEFDLDLLAAVDNKDEDDVLDALEAAVRQGLVVELRDRKDDAFRFAHPIARRVLREALTGARRRRLHARIAEALDRRRESGRPIVPVDLAHHFLEGRMPERAVPFAFDAAQTAWRAWALDQTEEALDIVESAIGEGVRLARVDEARLACLRAETLALRSRASEAIAFLEKARSILAEEKDPRLAVRVARNLGRLLAEQGTGDQALAILLPALHEVEIEGLDQEPARLRIAIGHAFDVMGEFERAYDWIQSGLSIAREQNDRPTQVLGETACGQCLCRMGRFAEALEAGQRALALALAAGNRKQEWESLCLIGNACYEQGDLANASEYFARGRDVTRGIGDARGESVLLNNIGEVHRRAGRYEDAIACYEQILAISPERAARQQEGVAINLALAYIGLGQVHSARKYAEQARTLNDATGDLFANAYLHYTLAEVALLDGHVEQALDEAREAAASGQAIHSPEVEWQALWAEARACDRLGEDAGRRDALHRCIDVLNMLASSLATPEDRERFFADKQEILDAAIEE